MSNISVSLPSDGETIEVSDYNTPITTIVNEINGNLDNSNIDAAAAISGSKLADTSVSADKIDFATLQVASGMNSGTVTTSVNPANTTVTTLDVSAVPTGAKFAVTVSGFHYSAGNLEVFLRTTYNGVTYEQGSYGIYSKGVTNFRVITKAAGKDTVTIGASSNPSTTTFGINNISWLVTRIS